MRSGTKKKKSKKQKALQNVTKAVQKPPQKVKHFKATIKRLLGYLMQMKFRLVCVFILTIISISFAITAPKILIKAIDRLEEGVTAKIKGAADAAIDFQYIGLIILILIGLYLVSALALFFMQLLMVSITKKTILKLRNDIGEKLDRLPLKFFDNRSHGDMLSRVSNDIERISIALKENITGILSSSLFIVGIVAMMLSIHPLVTLIPLGAVLAAFIYSVFIMSISRKYYISERAITGEINGHTEEMYNGHKIIRAYCKEEKSIAQFKAINSRLYQVSWKAEFYTGLIAPGLYFILHFSYVLICIFGALLTINGQLSIGMILAFIQYSRDASDPILEIANSASMILTGIASAERIFEILDEPEEIAEAHSPRLPGQAKGKVQFEKLTFGYHPRTAVIKDLNITVQPGQICAIVGPTGAGKTTLINLLLRFYEPDRGRILIDGLNINDMKREELRKMFGLVLQDTWLLNGTVKENIAYGKKNASQAEVIRASQLAQAHHFIQTLPHGYETILSDAAASVSEGQKQLLTIARAILTNPKILILDEATSDVDTRTEILIQKAMKQLMTGRTCFIIAHRLSTIRDADLILVMKDGNVIEQGTHAVLLADNTFYHELYHSHFEENKNLLSDLMTLSRPG